MTNNDFDVRRTDFLAEYGKLVEKYKCDFLSFPMYIPDTSVESLPAFKTVLQQQVVDRSEMPQKSPFVA